MVALLETYEKHMKHMKLQALASAVTCIHLAIKHELITLLLYPAGNCSSLQSFKGTLTCHVMQRIGRVFWLGGGEGGGDHYEE